jgi:hypothetical protein
VFTQPAQSVGLNPQHNIERGRQTAMTNKRKPGKETATTALKITEKHKKKRKKLKNFN